MRERTHRGPKDQTREQRETFLPQRLAPRRPPAIARALAGDTIATSCRELGGSTRGRDTWRARDPADQPTWTQAWSRRPEPSPAQRSAPLAEDIVSLRQAWFPQGAGPASAAALQQVLQDKAIAPVPSRRTIYRVLQRRAKEVTQPTSMTYT